MFACLVAGELVQTDCVQVSENQFAFALQKASSIHHLAVFLTGTEPFPDHLGGIVYFSWPPYDNWQVLGYLSNAKPSAIFAVKQNKGTQESSGVVFNYQNQWQSVEQEQECVAQIGIEITDLDSIHHQFGDRDKEAVLAEVSTAKNLDYYCKKMLESFFNYGESFVRDQVDPYTGNTEKIIPAKVFEQWYSNFEKKLQNNPHFWKD